MNILKEFRNYWRLNKPKDKVILVICLVVFVLLRFDISYNLWSHQVKKGETLWSIFEEKVFHNSTITGISLNYLKAHYPHFDWNHMEKNENREGGYTVYIRFNKINIKAPNKDFIIKDAPILPQAALGNHALEVITYDLLVVALALFIFVNLDENNFLLNLKSFKNIVFIPVLLAIGAIIIIFIALFLYIQVYYFFRPYRVLITPERVIYQK